MAETEMVERVAKACRDAVALDRGRSVPFKEMSYIVARAAIEAMREPTVVMTQAGGETLLNKECPPWDAGDTYRAMIDAALSPPSKD